MKIVSTENAPEPKGHYSQAIIHNGTVYLSGILPIDKESGNFVGGDIVTQCEVVFNNFKAILEASGSCLIAGLAEQLCQPLNCITVQKLK